MGAANADVDQGGGRYPDLGRIYLEVVQLVMLYRLEMWVMKPGIGRVLGRFHHRVACRLTGGGHSQGRDRVWVYLSLEDAMADVGLQEVKSYVSRR